MQVYKNEHVTISIEYHIHLICKVWTGVPGSAAYREAGLVALQLAEAHQLKRWLIDQQQVRLFRPKDIQWFIEDLLPLLADRLPKSMQVAIVLTDLNQFAKLGSDLTLRAALAGNPGLQSRYFTDKQEARDWLLAKIPATPQPAIGFATPVLTTTAPVP